MTTGQTKQTDVTEHAQSVAKSFLKDHRAKGRVYAKFQHDIEMLPTIVVPPLVDVTTSVFPSPECNTVAVHLLCGTHAAAREAKAWATSELGYLVGKDNKWTKYSSYLDYVTDKPVKQVSKEVKLDNGLTLRVVVSEPGLFKGCHVETATSTSTYKSVVCKNNL